MIEPPVARENGKGEGGFLGQCAPGNGGNNWMQTHAAREEHVPCPCKHGNGRQENSRAALSRNSDHAARKSRNPWLFQGRLRNSLQSQQPPSNAASVRHEDPADTRLPTQNRHLISPAPSARPRPCGSNSVPSRASPAKPADGHPHTLSSTAPRSRGYRSAWSRCSHVQAAPARHANPPPHRAYGWQMSAAVYAG